MPNTQDSIRKKDHIDLAFKSQVDLAAQDPRFYYEPLLAGFPTGERNSFDFAGKKIKYPIWISSMTGGTEKAGKINRNLAQACAEFGLGMGLGSCRIILDDPTYFEDFNLRPIIGTEQPFYANLGIAQIEESFERNEIQKIADLVGSLDADGLFVHVNPLQEWLQPEGDVLRRAPLDVIQELVETVDFPIIVKEVGQGMGPKSLKALLQLPIQAVDFAAHGGTNFSKVELLRSDEQKQSLLEPVSYLGHSAEEMVIFTNEILNELGDKALCKEVIISGGVKDFLDGYYLTNKLNSTAIYGQGSAFLKRAQHSYEALQEYINYQVKGLELAETYLTVR